MLYFHGAGHFDIAPVRIPSTPIEQVDASSMVVKGKKRVNNLRSFIVSYYCIVEAGEKK